MPSQLLRHRKGLNEISFIAIMCEYYEMAIIAVDWNDWTGSIGWNGWMGWNG